MIHELEGVLQVVDVDADAHPQAVVLVEVVGEEAQDQLVHVVGAVVAFDGQVGHVARLEELPDARQEEGFVVRPRHRRQHGYKGSGDRVGIRRNQCLQRPEKARKILALFF